MEDLLGGSIWSFLGLGLVMFGAASWMMGQATALTWRSPGTMIPYAALLAATVRFLDFALFGGTLLSLTGFVCVWVLLSAMAGAGFKATRAGQMASQYPWLFSRTGPFGWRPRS